MWPFNNPSASEDKDRPGTRSQAGNLLPPLELPLNRRGLGRGRSRTPSPVAPGQQFQFPPPEPEAIMAERLDMAEIHRIAAAAAAEAAAAAVAAAFATQASLTHTVTESVHKRKPDLPKFDAKNVELWIKRMEAAYSRAAITTAKDKFAFLESQFDVGFNPKINGYLFGDPTDDRWTEFLAYLRKEYGRTQQQKAASVLDGISRDGRRPTQLLAFIDDRLDNVSVDDIKKEMLLCQLPREVRHALSEAAETATAEQLAQQADHYFDREGKQLNAASGTAVNAIQEDNTVNAEDGDINAAFGNQSRGRNNFQPRSQQQQPASKPANGDSRRQGNGRSKSRPRLINGECFYHNKFKDQALNCQEGCKHSGKVAPGNGQAGRRT